MTFGFLAPFGLLAGVLCAAVLWLHARRKRRLVVPSLRIWRTLQIPSGTARAARQWPPLSWPLALQLLAVVFAAFALAQPYWGPKPAADEIFILDLGDEAETRALAKDRLAARLSAQTAPKTVSVILAGEAPRLVAAQLAPSQIDLEAIFSALPEETGREDWSGVARRIEMLAPSDATAITLLSEEPIPAALLAFGTKREALTDTAPSAKIALATRPMQTPYRFAFKGEIVLPEGAQSADLMIGYSDGGEIAPLPFLEKTLLPNAAGRLLFEGDVTLPGAGIMTVSVDGIERARYLTQAPSAEEGVLYIGKGEQPLLGALRAIDDIVLYQAESLPSDLSPYKMVMVDGTLLPEAPALPTLWIGPSGLGQTPPAALEATDPDAWDLNSPLLAGVDVKSLIPGPAWDLALPNEAQKVLTAKGKPLVALSQNAAWLAFDPRQSNWIGTPELAIFTAALHDALVEEPPLASCLPAHPCFPDNRLIGDDLTKAPADPEDRLIAGPDAKGLARAALALAFAAVLADMLLQMRGRKGLSAPAPLSVVALVLLALGLLQTPLLRPAPGSQLIAIDVPTSTHHNGLSLAEVTILSGDPPRLAAAGPAEATALKNTSEALELAAASVPEGRAAHVLLGAPLSRRPETLPAADLPISYLPPQTPPASEVVLRAIEITGHPMQGEPLPLTLRVHALAATEATLVLRLDGKELAQSPISLSMGDNRIETLLPALEGGEAFVEAELLLPAGIDDLPENNVAGLLLDPTTPRPIAVISPEPAHGRAFAELLRAQGLEADVLFPDETPDYMRDWMRYGGIVLLNTPSIELLPHRQRMIQRMVNDYGLGLLILGGKNAFGPGGYYETPLEDLSPVSARVPRESPEVAMVFVLDRSGSMQQPVGDADRLALAKRATVSALDLLNPQSQIGIVTFDAESSVVYPLQTFDIPTVSAALDKVDPGGGTSIYPGLVEAYDMLKTSESPAKHVIVMTDGLSQPGDWGGILRMMNAANITVSGVAIGYGADVDAVKTIARLGRGAAHVSSDFAALPSILSQEAMMFASPVEEGQSQPRWTGVTAPFLGDLPARLPPIDGFVLTTPKDEANTAILTQDADGNDMPLLSWWRVGNGQVMAFTSDATGPWTNNWHSLPGYAPMFANALRAFHPPLPPTGLTLDLQPEGEAIALTLSALSREGDPINSLQPTAEITYCAGQDCAPLQTLPLRFEAPGIYTGRFLPEAAGRYSVTLSQDSIAAVPVSLGEEPPANPRASYHLAWPESLDPTRGNGEAQWLAARTGGGEEESLAALRARLPQMIWETKAAVTPWAIAALLVFMLELIRRYAELPLFHRRRAAQPSAKEGQTQ